MFKGDQVRVGRGKQDEDAMISALAVAQELYAAQLWDGRGQLIVHFPSSLRQQLRTTAVERFDRSTRTTVHTGVHQLKEGTDFEVEPPPALDPSQWRQLRFFE
jgi:hypothetical protein